jgi:hypothetical protein
MANEQNLRPQKKGEPAPPGAGRPKGSRSLSTIIRQIGENPPDWKKVRLKGKDEFVKQYKSKSAWEAVVYVALSQAMAGDNSAREFLAKRGYGDRLDITSDDKPLPIVNLDVYRDQGVPQDSPPPQKGEGDSGRDGGGQDDSGAAVPDSDSPDGK